jgi:hypothetical protein
LGAEPRAFVGWSTQIALYGDGLDQGSLVNSPLISTWAIDACQRALFATWVRGDDLGYCLTNAYITTPQNIQMLGPQLINGHQYVFTFSGIQNFHIAGCQNIDDSQ